MADLAIAVDPGGSFLKCFSTLNSFMPQLTLMEPEVALVPQQSIEVYERNKIGSAAPENSAWIEYKGKYQAVGFLARRRFHADLQLQKRKFELAIPKVLAVVGALAEKHNLANGSAIGLGIVFPWGEYQDRALFKQLITEALSNFRFRGKECSFVLDTFICLPEGGGVLTRGRAPGASLREQTVAVVMVGYRDVSVLLVERGDMSNGCTEPLGFARLIETVKYQTSGLNQHKLVTAICKAGKGINPKALAELVETTDPAYRDDEIAGIRRAIALAKEEYWMMLSQWLRLRIPRDVDEVILAGGTANYFRAELNALFSYTQTNWCESLEKQLNSNFAAQIESKSLSYRLTDVYGLFFYLCGTRSQSKVASHGETN